MRMDRLDGIETGEIARRILEPKHLKDLLEGFLRTSHDRQHENRQRLAELRRRHKEAEAAIARLLTLVEKGLMELEDVNMRERLVGLRLQRDELAAEIADLRKRLSMNRPALTPEKIDRLGKLLRDRLFNGPKDLRHAYTKLSINEVRVDDEEIRISGSKGMLARAAETDLNGTSPEVLSFVREWRTKEDERENWRIKLKVLKS